MSTKSTDHIFDEHAASPSRESCIDDSIASDWYDSLRAEVDFHCTFCEGVHMGVAALEEKVKAAYEATAQSMQGLYDAKEIANKWFGMYSFAWELLSIAEMSRDAHQICGADLSGIQKYCDAALERFSIHCVHAE